GGKVQPFGMGQLRDGDGGVAGHNTLQNGGETPLVFSPYPPPMARRTSGVQTQGKGRRAHGGWAFFLGGWWCACPRNSTRGHLPHLPYFHYTRDSDFINKNQHSRNYCPKSGVCFSIFGKNDAP